MSTALTQDGRQKLPRVIMVVRLYDPWIGGTERQAQTLSKGLREAGLEVRVLTGRWFRDTARRERIDGVEVVRHHTLWEFFGIRGLRKFGGYLYMLTLAWELWRRRHTYDVIHVHGMNYHSAVAVWMGRRLGRPTLTKLANSGSASDVDKMRSDRQLYGSRWLLSTALRSDTFVALNHSVTADLVEAGVEEEQIVAIPNGVRTDHVRSRADHVVRGTSEIVFVGRLHKNKDLTTLIAAIARVVEAGRRVHLSLIGEGPEHAALQREIAQLGVDDSVSLRGASDDVGSLLEASDVFVLPSRAEGLSNALLEAMTHSLPVIVSDITANTAVITHDRDGLVYPAGDDAALAHRITALIDDEALRTRLGRRAREVIEDEYALERVVGKYVDLYHAMTTDQTGMRAETR